MQGLPDHRRWRRGAGRGGGGEEGRRGGRCHAFGGGHHERRGLQGLQKGLEGSEHPEAGQPWRIVGIAGASLDLGFRGYRLSVCLLSPHETPQSIHALEDVVRPSGNG